MATELPEGPDDPTRTRGPAEAMALGLTLAGLVWLAWRLPGWWSRLMSGVFARPDADPPPELLDPRLPRGEAVTAGLSLVTAAFLAYIIAAGTVGGLVAAVVGQAPPPAPRQAGPGAAEDPPDPEAAAAAARRKNAFVAAECAARLLGWVVVGRWLAGRMSPAGDAATGLRWDGLGPGLASGIGGLLAVWPVCQILMVLAVLAVPPKEHEALTRISALAAYPADLAFLVFCVTAVTGFTEEYFFRGLLQPALRGIATKLIDAPPRRPEAATADGPPAPAAPTEPSEAARWVAIIATAAAFAAVHIPLYHAMPSLFVLGLFWGLLFETTGRIAAPALSHALFNALNVTMQMMK
jgi:membrane protease YdiL (CAAX protease family)